MPVTSRPTRRQRGPVPPSSTGAAGARSSKPVKDRVGPSRERANSPEPVVRGGAKRPAILDLLDLLGRRWSLRILWEISAASLRFTEIQERCDAMSPSVLNQRLAELAAAGVVHVNGQRRYALTADGTQLVAGLRPLDAWARRWTRRSTRGRG